MSTPTPPSPDQNRRLLGEEPEGGFFADLWHFLRTSGKWWMTPLIVVLILLGAILILAQTAAAPLIYTLF